MIKKLLSSKQKKVLRKFLSSIKKCRIRKNAKPIFNINEIPLKPIDAYMGTGRGKAIDRVYIERFLDENRDLITGDCMEIGECLYIDQFGHDVKNRYVFTVDKETIGENVIHGDLETGNLAEEKIVDTFILTQTLPFMYNITAAANNIVRMLKPGGVAIITVRGVSAISPFDECRWGDYWGFTVQSLRKLFKDVGGCIIEKIESYGNVRTAMAFLYGLCAEDMVKDVFDVQDKYYPVIIGLTVRKAE